MMVRRLRSQKCGYMKSKKQRNRLEGRTRKAAGCGILDSGTKKVKVSKLSSGFVAGEIEFSKLFDRWLREAKFFGADKRFPNRLSIRLTNVSVFLAERLLAAA